MHSKTDVSRSIAIIEINIQKIPRKKHKTALINFFIHHLIKLYC